MARTARLLGGLAFALFAIGARADDPAPARAIVADFANTSRDRHTMMVRTATDAVAVELHKRGTYEVLSRQEVDRAAKQRGIRAPYRDEDLTELARALDAPLVITGEIRRAESRIVDRQREVEVGLIVRVRDVGLGELINGAAERGTAVDPADGSKPDGELLMEAATSAAVRAASRIGDNRPILGTILSSEGRGPLMLNRGAGHGVRNKQEFVVFRDGLRVGRVKVFHIYSSYTELTVVDSPGGIQPQDRALAIFPEPKLER